MRVAMAGTSLRPAGPRGLDLSLSSSPLAGGLQRQAEDGRQVPWCPPQEEPAVKPGEGNSHRKRGREKGAVFSFVQLPNFAKRDFARI